jgi:hypothetical protein
MNNLQEIESAIGQLSTEDLAAFRDWFDEFDARESEEMEDLCLNLAMDEAAKTPLLQRDAALKFLESDENES